MTEYTKKPPKTQGNDDQNTSIKNAIEDLRDKELEEDKFTPNCFLLMGDSHFWLTAASARQLGAKAEFLPEGWVYQNKSDAEKVADRWQEGKRKIAVVPWHNLLVDDIWHGSKRAASLAKKKIAQELEHNKHNKKMERIKLECDASGLHSSWLYRDNLPDDMSEKDKRAFDLHKPEWDSARQEEEALSLKDHDLEREEEDVEHDTPGYVEEFNRKHAIVHTSQAYILTEKYDPLFKRKTFALESSASFQTTYTPKIAESGEPLTKLWLKHPMRREFLSGIIFDPENPGHHDGYYNLFQGFSVVAKRGDCSLFWELVYILTGHKKQIVDYIRRWLAHMIQKPWNLPEVAVCLRGLQGVGKGTFAEFIGLLVAQYYFEVSRMSQVVGKFNSHLKNLLLVYANEALWGGHKADGGSLKAIITDKNQAIEQKGVDVIQVRNCKRLIISSNEDWIVPLDLDDRRFLVVDVDPKLKGNKEFFTTLRDQMAAGGLEALMWDLQNEDINGWHPRDKPRCADGFDLKLRSMKTPHRWLYECLSRESLAIRIKDADTDWSGAKEVIKCRIHTDYSLFCEEQHVRPDDPGLFWKLIKQILGPLDECKNRIAGTRIPFISLPSLKDARGAFSNFAKEDRDELWED